jgi:hypothetical protein
VPEGLKFSECEHGIGGKNSPICYIHKKDPSKEALEKNKNSKYFPLTLPHMGSKFKVTLWVSGTPEQFILCVHSVIHACKQMEHDIKFSRAKEAVATAQLNLEIAKDKYVQVCNLEKKSKMEQRRKHTCHLRVPRGCKFGLR